MDLSGLSTEQLSSLAALSRELPPDGSSTEVREKVQELQVHRVELEMQNRALRETQGELERALQRYADLYDHLPIGYVTLSPQGRITQANLTAAGWLRRDRAALIGHDVSWFLNAFDAGRFAAHLEMCLRNGSDTLLDITLRLDGGVHLTVQLSSRRARQTGDGEPAVHTAITNIAKLRQTQEIFADIDREQEALASTLAHDLRTPLVTVSHFAQQLLREHGDSLAAEVKERLERLHGAALRTETTLHHLLDFNCFASDDVALDPLSLDHVIQQVMVELRPIIQRGGAEIVVERPLPCVRGSRLILGQVLANLLTHAIKAGPADQKPRLRISAETQNRAVVLKIAEIPTPAGEVSRDASEPAQFGWFERHRDRGGAPTDIALALVCRAIERMHGRASVEIDPVNGTRLLLELPRV